MFLNSFNIFLKIRLSFAYTRGGNIYSEHEKTKTKRAKKEKPTSFVLSDKTKINMHNFILASD